MLPGMPEGRQGENKCLRRSNSLKTTFRVVLYFALQQRGTIGEILPNCGTTTFRGLSAGLARRRRLNPVLSCSLSLLRSASCKPGVPLPARRDVLRSQAGVNQESRDSQALASNVGGSLSRTPSDRSPTYGTVAARRRGVLTWWHTPV